MNTQDFRPVDKLVGIILAIYGSLGVLAVLVLVAFGALFIAPIFNAQANTPSPMFPREFSGAVATTGVFLIGFFLLLLVASIAAAIGLANSQKWGFIACSAIHGVGVVLGLYKPGLQTLIGIAVCVYCVMRLSGSLPPKVE